MRYPVNTSCPFVSPNVTRAPVTGTTKSVESATRLTRNSEGWFSLRTTCGDRDPSIDEV